MMETSKSFIWSCLQTISVKAVNLERQTSQSTWPLRHLEGCSSSYWNCSI